MKIFAQVVGDNVIRIIKASTLTKARSLAISVDNYELVDVATFKKCENFESLGRVYDKANKLILPVKVFPSWILDKENVTWKPPIDQPNNLTVWDEESKSWV